MRTPETIYRQFIEFEEKAAAIYFRLASHFSAENPELSSFWLDMGLEEKQHAGLLQFCLEQRLFAPNFPKEEHIRTIGELFQRIEELAENSSVDVDAAFGFAAEMEGSEVNESFCLLTTSVHNSMYLLRRKIEICDADHINKLLAAGRKFGVSQTILRKLDGLEKRDSITLGAASSPQTM